MLYTIEYTTLTGEKYRQGCYRDKDMAEFNARLAKYVTSAEVVPAGLW